MRVLIIDVDWFGKKSFIPNPVCMKFSSYHKQIGDIVSFANTELDINDSYDMICAFREKITSPMPKRLSLKSDKVFLYGKSMRFYDRYTESYDDIVAMCRPDYLLYDLPETNKILNADVAQFFNKGKRMELVQNYENSYRKTKVLLVTDEDFWKYSYEDLMECLWNIRRKEISFLHPIKIEHLIEDERKLELFFALRFKQNSKVSFDISSITNPTEKDFENLIKILKRAGEEERKISLPRIEVPAVMYNHHEDEATVVKDFERSLQLVSLARRVGISLIIKSPPRITTVYYALFELLESWTTNYPRSSLFDFLAGGLEFIYECPIKEILRNNLRINIPTIRYMRMIGKDMMKKYGMIKWLDDYTDNEAVEEL